ncbi:shikimate dehydrogenase [Thiosulfativibrio zosterae]|uniref:Shikimate dehydrogenase (NADP(+)) n=1 Tax=Thiosulfativibrio zosterae TaxID=2675053 RepID=A0A6F8PQE3_9GAMM|nr:shikimate dehydrogenase [Thiosulfativibrio zosterae]BBP44343.1 shikimate dehydrogenase (NADP(+)) [Thiosulfativibrio zosterae]
MTDLYAVVGDPIAHSKSPTIHRLFAEQTGQDMVYEAIRIDSDQTTFDHEMAIFKMQGYKGINITVPYKLNAFEYADELTPRAQQAHAVNTFVFQEDGRVLGDNTDGVGLMNDITQNAAFEISGKSVLILGAGGAVQGILEPLLALNPSLVHIANRTAERALKLGERFSSQCPITASGWQDIPEQPFDLIINGTSASLDNKLPPISTAVICQNSLVYDMMYGKEPTIFMNWAKQAQPNCQVRDGLGMLVGQAAEAFFLWRGIRPETQRVIEFIRKL